VIEKLDLALDERISRLEGFIYKLNLLHQTQPEKTREQHRRLCEKWPEIMANLASYRNYSGDEALLKPFIKSVEAQAKSASSEYLTIIQNLDSIDKKTGTQWLQKIVDEVVESGMKSIED
jgi:hypothetical protein